MSTVIYRVGRSLTNEIRTSKDAVSRAGAVYASVLFKRMFVAEEAGWFLE